MRGYVMTWVTNYQYASNRSYCTHYLKLKFATLSILRIAVLLYTTLYSIIPFYTTPHHVLEISRSSSYRTFHYITLFTTPLFRWKLSILSIYTVQIGASDEEYDDDHSECLLTFIAQMDPKGWIWKMFGYQQESLQKVINYRHFSYSLSISVAF